MLDTQIYNGHTTTADALWAGVPVVTLEGRHFASRVSASLLRAIDLPELICADMTSYESLALRLALNAEELQGIKEKLHRTRSVAPLFDTVSYTRNLERVYGTIWQRYLDGSKPDHFD